MIALCKILLHNKIYLLIQIWDYNLILAIQKQYICFSSYIIWKLKLLFSTIVKQKYKTQVI